jgi:hypothetical protein
MKPTCRDWANAIGHATFSVQEAGRVVYLAIDEEEIGRIGREFGLAPTVSYDSFRAAVIAEVRYGWPDPGRPLQEGQFPGYLALLAAQVVAAFQMHDDGLTGAKAYWRRLREFLGQSPEDKRPEGLENWRHKALWKGLERWANETNGGRLGRVRLVEQVAGHHLVAEPLGQCLLRRADLEKLRDLFAERGRPDPEPYRGRRLKELVDDVRCWLPGRYFTKHSGRVLDDPDRFDAAWEQLEAEYERFLAEECPDAAPRTRPPTAAVRRKRSGTIVRLQIVRKRLSGGLYRRQDGRLTTEIADVGEVLRRCYLRTGREGSTTPHKPPDERRLLATRDDESGAFEETSRCRAGDDALLLVPEWAVQAWLDDADPNLFDGVPRRYRPSFVDRVGWEPLEGLPAGWLALRFQTRVDLSDVTLDGKWIGVVDRRATRLRAVGGLTLRRGVWMLGAGPTVHVVGPGTYDHVLVDGESHPLDASRCATPDLGAGEHGVRLPGSASRVLRFRVQEPRFAAPPELVGWNRVEGGWPASAGERRRIVAVAGTLHGPRLVGDWPPRRKPGSEPPQAPSPDSDLHDELAAMILAVELRRVGRPRPLEIRLLASARAVAARSANPLLRGMLRAGDSFISDYYI